MIALGLFFGLRNLAPRDPASLLVGPPAGEAPSPLPAPLPVIDPAVSQRQIADALGRHHARLREECYLPRVVGDASPPALRFELNFTFDPAGLQIARGLVEIGETSLPEVTKCLLARLPPLQIPPPGQSVPAIVPLSFEP